MASADCLPHQRRWPAPIASLIRYEIMRRIDLNRICKRGPLDAAGRPQLQPPARGVHVRAVCWDARPEYQRVLVGTESNEVVRIDLTLDGSDEAKMLTQVRFLPRSPSTPLDLHRSPLIAGAVSPSVSLDPPRSPSISLD